MYGFYLPFFVVACEGMLAFFFLLFPPLVLASFCYKYFIVVYVWLAHLW